MKLQTNNEYQQWRISKGKTLLMMKTASGSYERHQKLCKENTRIFAPFHRAKILVCTLHPHGTRTHSTTHLNVIKCSSMIRYTSYSDCFANYSYILMPLKVRG